MNPILVSKIKHSFRKNLVPGLALQAMASLILLTYFFFEPSQKYFAQISEIKAKYGYWYSSIATALFGAVIPTLYLILSKRLNKNYAGEIIGLSLFWGIKGIEVDALYTFQAYIFGDNNDFWTIFKKTCADQFIYSAFWASTSTTIFYLWKNEGYSWNRLKPHLNKDLFKIQIPALIFSNWMVWFPAVSIVYCLPLALQIPIFNLVLCFWVLIVAVLNDEKS